MKFNSFSAMLTIPSVLVALAMLTPVAIAQQQSMTIEELEQYIEEQKAALEEVKANREETEKKALEVREALEVQEARRTLVEEELEMLCKQQEELKPGSYEDCKSNKNN